MLKRIVGSILVLVGALLVLSAMALFGYNLWDDHRAQAEVDSVREQLAEVLEEVWAAQKPVGEEHSSEIVIPDHVLNPSMDMPAVEIDGQRYIGMVTIPALDLELPVMETWSYSQMKIAPCRYSGSVYLNNLIICAHNYAAHFGRLKNLQPGDAVLFTDVDGNQFRYQAVNIETLSGTAVEEMRSGEWALTLFTCTTNGQARVTVRCAAE